MGAAGAARPDPDRGRLATPWRVAIGAAGVVNLAVAAYLTTQPTAVVEAWPWELTRLSLLFLAAMLAAVGVAALWTASSGLSGALPAGFLNLAVIFAGTAAWLARTDPDRRAVAAVLALVAALNVGLLVVTHRPRAHRADAGAGAAAGAALPPVLRWSFVAYTAVLAVVGIALIAGVDGVVPWLLGEGTATVFGWIFLGDACFFAYALRWPTADAGRAQLWAFLGYDLVLLPPLAATLPGADPAVRLNLVVYLAVLVHSAGLGLWYLVLRPLGRRRPPRAAVV